MLTPGYGPCLSLAPMWGDVAKTVDSDSLPVILIGYAVLRELAAVWIIIAVKVDGSHTEGTEQPEAGDTLAACVTVAS